MAFTKYLVPALSVATTAYAASCSTSSTMTVQSGGDASAIGSCTTFSGSVAIATGAASSNTLDLGNVQDITGDLIYGGDTNVQTFSAASLKSVGSVNITGLSALSALKFSSLQKVGNIFLESLPALQSFDFGSQFSQAGVITIVNTDVNDISSLSAASQVDGIIISDNQFLSNISFPIEEVGIVDIGPNNLQNGLNLDFPNLATAESLTFRNATEISTPSLANVTNTLGLYGNKITSYAAPNLTWVGALVINDNSAITNLSFPVLKNINSTQNATLQVANNTKLASIDGFPALEVVNGNVDFSGNIDNITLSKINNVVGAMFVDTSSTTFNCDPIKALQSSQVVKGADNCTSNDASPSGTSGGNGGSSTGSSGSASSSGVAVPLEFPSFTTGAGIFGALFALLL